MRFYQPLFYILVTLTAFGLCSCARPKPATPLDTLRAYTQAIKKKDTTEMKLLLSKDSIKMHEQEAKAQNTTLDEVVKREPLFTENQSSVEFRNEKVEGDKANIEMKNSFGMWETVFFVKEDGDWKIDKQGFANQILQQSQQSDQKLNDMINQENRQMSVP
jgi:Domain of unknown function (DUF4878)